MKNIKSSVVYCRDNTNFENYYPWKIFSILINQIYFMVPSFIELKSNIK